MYEFKGIITSLTDKEVPFELINGSIHFPMRSLSNIDLSQRNFLMSGKTDDGKDIRLLIDYLWKTDFSHITHEGKEAISIPHIEGIVLACAVLEPYSFEKINSLGFYSTEIHKITNHTFSGCLNDNNSSWMNIKKPLASYSQNDHEYKLSIGFYENNPYYKGQLLELKSDKPFDIKMMKDSYWTIKRMLNFLYQKRIVPLQEILLRIDERNIGRLFVESIDDYCCSFGSVKCIPISSWEDKLSLLLQKLVDRQIYLRHIPIFKEDEKVVTHGRFLMALIGLENVLDFLNIHVVNINNRREHLKERIAEAIRDNEKEISNFFILSSLGADIDTISEELATMRNKLAHGYLEYDLTIKSSFQMHFLMLFILYLQFVYIGFDKDEASRMVPHILFDH